MTNEHQEQRLSFLDGRTSRRAFVARASALGLSAGVMATLGEAATAKLASATPQRPVPVGDGLSAVYFDSPSLDDARAIRGATGSRVEATVDFVWGRRRPHQTVRHDLFAARFAGEVSAPSSGAYQFRTTCSGGVRLWVDGQLVVDRWAAGGAKRVIGNVALQADRRYELRLECYNPGGAAFTTLEWRRPGQQSFEVVPQEHLYSGERYLPEALFGESGYAVIDVKKSYGAQGDGITDDTAAIQRAITENIQDGFGTVLYFPNGTYRVGDTLRWRDAEGVLRPWLSFWGQNRHNTVIRLHEDSPGFTDPETRKAVLWTSSIPNPSFSTGEMEGIGNASYKMMIEDLTVAVAAGNPGAVAVKYNPNNMGALRNVSIRSEDPAGAGRIGLWLYGWTGPSLVKNLSVDGFDHGVYNSGNVFFEHLTLRGQRVAGMGFTAENGVWGHGKGQAVRDLRSRNEVPAIWYEDFDGAPAGLVTLLDAELIGGGEGEHAVRMDAGSLHLRNLTSDGYAAAVKLGEDSVPGADHEFFTSKDPLQLFASPARSLQLAVRETPELFQSSSPEDWANVKDYKWPDDPDDTASFQRAIDSGKPIVYLPGGTYSISDTVHLRGSVRRIAGMMSQVHGARGRFDDFDNPRTMFRVGETASEVAIDHLTVWPWESDLSGALPVLHASSKALILQDVDLEHAGQYPACFRNTAGAGPLFIEDVMCTKWRFDHPQQVFARHWNVEWRSPGIINRGGTFWILGLKSETGITVIENHDGGVVELLGGEHWSNWQAEDDNPLYVNDSSRFSAVFDAPSPQQSYPDEGGPYHSYVVETRDGITRHLDHEDIAEEYDYGRGKVVPLYTGYQQ